MWHFEGDHHCASLKKPENGQVWPEKCFEGSKHPVGFKCFFTCDAGYELDGKLINTCVKENGFPEWKHEQPTCREGK